MTIYQVLRITWESTCCTSQAGEDKTLSLKHMTLEKTEQYIRKILKYKNNEKWQKYWKVIQSQEYVSLCSCDCGDVIIIKPTGKDIKFNAKIYSKMKSKKTVL